MELVGLRGGDLRRGGRGAGCQQRQSPHASGSQSSETVQDNPRDRISARRHVEHYESSHPTSSGVEFTQAVMSSIMRANIPLAQLSNLCTLSCRTL